MVVLGEESPLTSGKHSVLAGILRFNFIKALLTVTPNQSTDGVILSDFNEPEERRRQ